MPKYLFVTGTLAAEALADTLAQMQPDFEYDIRSLDISVAALMDTRYVARHLVAADDYDIVMLPGLCQGDLSLVQERVRGSVVRGPKDLKDIPAFFGRPRTHEGYGEHQVRILAEIVDAHRLSADEILAQAEYYRACGADIIDLGGPVAGDFPQVERVVSLLKREGYVVSLDTFNSTAILQADGAGVDYILSVNSSNLELVPRLSCKVVVIPDADKSLESLERNIAQLEEWGASYIIDPILDPVNFGFVESLYRFYVTRQRYPKAEMLMGLANVSELIEADSVGINALLMGIATELNMDYVLTTEVISWARGAVRELDIARDLMYYSAQRRVLPKHIDSRLVTVKDPPYESYTEAELRRMHRKVRDRNWRIFVGEEQIYVFNNKLFIQGTDVQELFAQMDVDDPSHAFYLGRELEKAALALRLRKRYAQDQDLRWGYLGGAERE